MCVKLHTSSWATTEKIARYISTVNITHTPSYGQMFDFGVHYLCVRNVEIYAGHHIKLTNLHFLYICLTHRNQRNGRQQPYIGWDICPISSGGPSVVIIPAHPNIKK